MNAFLKAFAVASAVLVTAIFSTWVLGPPPAEGETLTNLEFAWVIFMLIILPLIVGYIVNRMVGAFLPSHEKP